MPPPSELEPAASGRGSVEKPGTAPPPGFAPPPALPAGPSWARRSQRSACGPPLICTAQKSPTSSHPKKTRLPFAGWSGDRSSQSPVRASMWARRRATRQQAGMSQPPGTPPGGGYEAQPAPRAPPPP